MSITVIVTGTEKRELTLEALDLLANAGKIILHTERCGCGEWLAEKGIAFESFDDLYEAAEDFDEHAENAAERLLSLSESEVCYCVMTERDESLKTLLRKCPNVRVIGPLTARAEAPVVSFGALDIESAVISPLNSVYITEIDTRESASDIKLRLMDVYGDDAYAYVRMPDGGCGRLPLENLDRLKAYDHRTACLVNPTGAHADMETLLRQGKKEYYENADADADALAKRVADVVRCICAGEAHGELTAGEVFDYAMEELVNEQN